MKKLWDYISRLGCNPDLSEEEGRRIKLLARLNFITFVVLLLYIVVEVIEKVYVFIPGLILMQFCVFIDLNLIRTRHYAVAKHFAIAIIAVSIAFFILFTGRNSFSEALFIPLSGVPLIIFANKRTAFSYMILFTLLIPVLRYTQPYCTPLVTVTEDLMDVFRLVSVLSAVIVTYLITYYFKMANFDYESKLIHMNELVSEKNKEITDSINYAKHIQNAILPPAALIKQYFPESFILYLPKDIVAGDFYWMEQKNGKAIFGVCDCTGHGVPGAMVSVVCSNALNRAVKEFGMTEPGKILDKTRELVIETFVHDIASSGGNEVKDGMDISLLSYDAKTKELQWAGANNPLWIIRNKELLEFKPNKQPIGKSDANTPYTTHTIALQSNDVIYSFTDGYADQFGGQKGKKFKYSQFKTLLIENHALAMADQQNLIEQQLLDWKGELEQVDDILVIGIKIL